MIYYYCTCSNTRRRDVKHGKTPYREIDADEEGVCQDCGHYAVAAPQQFDPRTGDLRAYLMGTVKEPSDNIGRTPGGLSVKNQKGSKKYYAKKTNERRKDKNGNMDV